MQKLFTSILEEQIDNQKYNFDIENSGIITKIKDGIATVFGLSKVKMSELVLFENKSFGMVLNLNNNGTDIVIFGNDTDLKVGSVVKRTKDIVSIKVGSHLLGHVVDPFSTALDGSNLNIGEESEIRKVELKAPGIMLRESVREPLETGIKVIDSLIPIGRGQRELIIGDRQTGKTSIAIDAIIHQKKSK